MTFHLALALQAYKHQLFPNTCGFCGWI